METARAVTIPRGTPVRVRLAESLDTRRNRPGDRFTATLDAPIHAGGGVVVPRGVTVIGHVTAAKPSGRLRGRAYLALTLDSLQLDGESLPIVTSSVGRSSGSHKKRNWALMGGGSGLGAALGAVAGGVHGALIGAGAGLAAGTAGAAATGRKQVSLPVETQLTFRLQKPVEL